MFYSISIVGKFSIFEVRRKTDTGVRMCLDGVK